jgi:hypothetical protein
MKARLLYSIKETQGGFIRQLIVWHLQKPVEGCTHLFKYRFFFGTDEGVCLVRYDNERGKGDHRHSADKEQPYSFQGVKQLLSDFDLDIKQILEASK